MYHHIVDGSPMVCIVETSLRPERIAFSVLARHVQIPYTLGCWGEKGDFEAVQDYVYCCILRVMRNDA